MTRTQVYLPDDTHTQLLQLSQMSKVSFSQLLREGADMVIKSKTGGLTPTQTFLRALLSFPDSKRKRLSKSAAELVRDERA